MCVRNSLKNYLQQLVFTPYFKILYVCIKWGDVNMVEDIELFNHRNGVSPQILVLYQTFTIKYIMFRYPTYLALKRWVMSEIENWLISDTPTFENEYSDILHKIFEYFWSSECFPVYVVINLVWISYRSQWSFTCCSSSKTVWISGPRDSAALLLWTTRKSSSTDWRGNVKTGKYISWGHHLGRFTKQFWQTPVVPITSNPVYLISIL